MESAWNRPGAYYVEDNAVEKETDDDNKESAWDRPGAYYVEDNAVENETDDDNKESAWDRPGAYHVMLLDDDDITPSSMSLNVPMNNDDMMI